MFAALRAGGSLPVFTQSAQAAAAAPASTDSNSEFQNNDQSINKSLQVKVFNIPEGTEEVDIKNHFLSCGEVTAVKILPTRDGKVTTLGYITFTDMDGVRKACDEKNNVEFNGSPLRVTENGPQGSGGGAGRNRDGGRTGVDSVGGENCQCKVYNIPKSTQEELLKAYFGTICEVIKVKILPCREGKDVTLGFVTFASKEDCNRAISELNEKEFNGSYLRIQSPGVNGGAGSFSAGKSTGTLMGASKGNNIVASDEKAQQAFGRGAQLMKNAGQINGVSGGRPGGRGPQAKVFGIPEGTDYGSLKELFASAGEVKFVKIMPRRDGYDTCLGFIDFATSSEVEAAVSQFDGQDFNGSTLKVMVGQSRGGGSSNSSQIDSNEGHHSRERVTSPISNVGQAVTYIPPPPPETEADIFQQGVNQGINFDDFDCIPVEFTGNNTPNYATSFTTANLHEKCLRNIERSKYEKPTPVQRYAIPTIIAQRDLMACAQTGSGKTGAFLLPIITNLLNEGVSSATSCSGPVFPQVCILSPTRELTLQIFHEAKRFAYNTNIKPVVVYGGVSVNHQISRLEMGCHILVATPGRLDDFVKRGKISFKNLKYLVLDEADKMLDMGFGPHIEQIINNSEMPPKGRRVTLMFSATFPETIQQMAAKFLHDYLFLTVGRVGGTCSDVKQVIMEVQGSNKRNTLEKLLATSGTDRTLVFVERKKDADFLASFLSQRDFPATSLNADRSQKEREEALDDFRKGVAPILVATAVAARGLDINDVKHVINYDLPSDATEYVHRIGRTGRIGNKGLATSFYDAGRDQKLARGLVKLLNEAEQDVPDWLQEAAFKAIATGYGPVSGQSRDQRFGGKSRNGGGGAPTSQVGDDEDEEW